MTVALYARRKQWPLEGVSIELRHSRTYAEDCAECETTEGKLDRIETQVSLAGALGAEARERLLEIAERCPVHRTLTSQIDLRTRLADGKRRAPRAPVAAEARQRREA
jgi:uncharacterized OsmC-like protein